MSWRSQENFDFDLLASRVTSFHTEEAAMYQGVGKKIKQSKTKGQHSATQTANA